ncbi:MAG: hypothetical protein K2H72_10140, partial [Muribaculaceae bacterium]|nr:hypothetical protein [Muribaculaceae bacterium]
MIQYIRLFICLFTSILLSAPSIAAGQHPAVKANIKLLSSLDSLIDRQSELTERKGHRIKSLMEAFSYAQDKERQIDLANRLFEEYRYYDSDSALKYSRLMYDLAQHIHPRNDSLLATFIIDQAYMYSIQGFHGKAAELLDGIPREILKNTDIGLKYYKAREYGASMELV